jgi:glycosyltransferase involved in cell wall biosynthesis
VAARYGLSRRELDKFVVVPHASYIGLYEDVVDRASARAWLGLGDSEIVFLFFGNVRPYKGVFELIETFGAITQPLARLLVVGQPLDEAVARELAAAEESDTRIRVTAEFVDANDVQRFFRASDYVVLPFRDVLTSGSLLLAMSFGRAVIAPSLGCIPEVVDARGAILYNRNDPDALRQALREAMERDPEKMGAASRRRAEQLTWDEAARTSATVYRQLLADAPRRKESARD